MHCHADIDPARAQVVQLLSLAPNNDATAEVGPVIIETTVAQAVHVTAALFHPDSAWPQRSAWRLLNTTAWAASTAAAGTATAARAVEAAVRRGARAASVDALLHGASAQFQYGSTEGMPLRILQAHGSMSSGRRRWVLPLVLSIVIGACSPLPLAVTQSVPSSQHGSHHHLFKAASW
jgi:hypothetical protein